MPLRRDYEQSSANDPDYAEALQHALGLFKEGEYWETHEALERVWLLQHGVDKHFLAGMIQLACAIYKTRKGNARAGRRIFARALGHLAWVADTFRGIDVRALEWVCMMALRDSDAFPEAPKAERVDEMERDEIVEEIRAIRAKHAEKFNYDIEAICEDLRKREKSSDHPIVSREPKRLLKPSDG